MVFECGNCHRNSTAESFCSECGERILPKQAEAPSSGGGQIASPLSDVIKRAMSAKPQGVVAEAKQKVAKRMEKASGEMLVVCDLSGSMAEGIGGLSVSKYEHLEIALEDIRKAFPKVRVVGFNSTVKEIKGKLPPPGGGTDLAGALKFAGKFRPAKTIIISDGIPDNEHLATCEADTLTGIIDTIYCGPDGHPAIEFLRSLSRLAGGTSLAWDGFQSQLSANIRGLLMGA